MDAVTSHRYRFGRFELDAQSGELHRDGVTVVLQQQPLQVLLLLIERGGEIVTREELRRRVWPNETFVDFDQGLNSIVRRLRDALRDTAERPLYIETLPRRGYRLLVQVQSVPAHLTDHTEHGSNALHQSSLNSGAASTELARPLVASIRRLVSVPTVLLVVAVAGGAAVYRIGDLRGRRGSSERPLRLAILPFENLTGKEDQQFFADGLHEEMIYRLGRMQPRRLTVIARTSVMRYRDAPKAIAGIAQDLGADFVLEGSVRQAGDRFRVTAQLIRSADQSHLWTETYDRSWADIFAIQSDVGARVADSLVLELLPLSEAGEAAGISPKAHEHYLKGRYYWNQRTRDPSGQLSRAIEQFTLAIAEQPAYALAYAGLADSYNSIFFANPALGETPYARAREALDRALELNPRLASAYSTRAWMTLHFDRNLADAQHGFEHALELDPTDSLTRFRYAHLLAIRGRLGDAEREADAARQSDPLSASIAGIRAWFAYYRGDNSAAMQRMQEASALEGDPTKLHVFEAYLDSVAGNCPAAVTKLNPWTADVDTLRMGEAVFARTRCGNRGAVDELEQTLLARRLTYSTAMFHFARGEMDAFYEWLNRAIDERFPEPLYLGIDPVFGRERRTPRFEAVLRRVGL